MVCALQGVSEKMDWNVGSPIAPALLRYDISLPHQLQPVVHHDR